MKTREFVPPSPVTDEIVEEQVHVHVSCEQEIDPDEAAERKVYACSRCGGTVVPDQGERARCPECHVFCAKQADASCPQCEEEIDLVDDEIEERTVWRTSDGHSHDSLREAEVWVKSYDIRVAAARERHGEMVAMEERIAEEGRVREERLVAAIDRLKAAGAAMLWARDDWKGWKRSMSVYTSAADLMVMLGLEPVPPTSDADFDRIWAAMVERTMCAVGATLANLAEPRMGGWYLKSWGSLWTDWGDEDGRDPSMTSWDTDEFLAYVDRWFPA